MALAETDIQPDLDRRRPGMNQFVTQRKESDQVQILSGVYEGRTTGTPIALLIKNEDQRSQDYSQIAQSFRPGHADYAYWRKYGLRDPRGGGRSSARLTAPTVAAGAVAKKWLREKFDIQLRSCITQIGQLKIDFDDWKYVGHNPFCAAVADVSAIEEYLSAVRKSGDSCGARMRAVASHVPAGLGEPLYDRLDADIAHALMGLNAVKGVEIGDGFASAQHLGSQHGDSMHPGPDGSIVFASNHDGGILGGISTGQDIEVSLAFKPTSSILIPRQTVNVRGESVEIITKGRHDPCVGLRAGPIVEALLALVLIDHALRQRAQCAAFQ
jgi:chorismate synthase